MACFEAGQENDLAKVKPGFFKFPFFPIFQESFIYSSAFSFTVFNEIFDSGFDAVIGA